ncbi:MAG: chemotaxis response regulator protein-glutamate methylesterase [Peptococcaceae bacterium]|nr:chemotaxis response regulator protein-glutamate methylesterase [Peptococcaceae bacterium]
MIVDDSMVSREILSRGISSDPAIEIVGKAVDPFDARDKILECKPDVMTCDIEMPKMNGIEFIKRLLPQYPIPIIVVSTVSEAVFEAMNAGAVDFATKPDVQCPKGVEAFIIDLIAKIKVASQAKIKKALPLATSSANSATSVMPSDPLRGKTTVPSPDKIIVMGASTGGTEALYSVLKALPENIPGILIVQHIPPVFSRLFANRLDTQTKLKVKEAQTGDYVEQGRVYIAPGDKHMRIVKIGEKYKIECFSGEKVNGHCPSADVLFSSAAKVAGNNAMGVILTGMGYDGAKGLMAMRRRGSRTIGQDESSSVVYGMPKAAFEIGAVERQVSLDAIPRTILSILKM